jgi:hypothetical protein
MGGGLRRGEQTVLTMLTVLTQKRELCGEYSVQRKKVDASHCSRYWQCRPNVLAGMPVRGH